MAKISVNADTKGPAMDVTINGNPIPNLTGLYGYREVDEKGNVIGVALTIETRELMEEGLVRSITYYSRGSARANRLEAMGNAIYSDNLPDFVGEEDKTKVQEDIAQFLGKKLGSA
jgi:hypothetical protein